MTFDGYRRLAVFLTMALAGVGAALVTNAPDGFAYLWETKVATESLTTVSALLLKLTNP